MKQEGTMKLYSEDKSTINIAHNPTQDKQMRYVEVDRRLLKENLNSDLICIPNVSTKRQLANVLTKGLGTQ